MAYVNLLMSINLNQVDAFLNNWRFDEDGNRLATDFAPYQTEAGTPVIDVYAKDVIPQLTAQGLWRVNDQGPVQNHTQLVSIKITDKTELDWTDPQDPDPKEILTVAHYLRETFPGGLIILDAFKKDGIRHGQELQPDDTITGQPTYPPIPKAQFLAYIPDDADESPATDYKEVNNSLGWANRRYV
jgi:hypothetical protein